jgi:hypothetical protein
MGRPRSHSVSSARNTRRHFQYAEERTQSLRARSLSGVENRWYCHHNTREIRARLRHPLAPFARAKRESDPVAR